MLESLAHLLDLVRDPDSQGREDLSGHRQRQGQGQAQGRTDSVLAAAFDEAASALVDHSHTGPTAAIDALKQLHALLTFDGHRAVGLELVKRLKHLVVAQKDTTAQKDERGLTVRSLDITIGIERHRLDLLLIPSVFAPEAWGMTFLEGLLRKPAAEYRERSLVELGCGSGWISIALGKFTDLESIHGLDINPHAPLVSTVNAIVNSYDERGMPLYDSQRRLLHEKCVFLESDLLSAVRERKVRADYVIGSIPQVPKADLGPVTAASDIETLYDFSNYCQLQGVHEDRHGLGLIARALDQAVGCLRAPGRVIFTLAGRPGTRVIERMFTQRGYTPKTLWSSRIEQAGDTDIGQLAELERLTGSDFEFYQHRSSAEPISAATAEHWQKRGGRIWHDLYVYEGELNAADERIQLGATLERMSLGKLLSHTDLSETGAQTGAQTGAAKLFFAERVAAALHRRPRLPYIHEQGSPQFREELAAYLGKFWGVPTEVDEIYVGPSRQAVAHALFFSLLEPGEEVLVSRSLAPAYTLSAKRAGVELLVGNNSVEELLELAERLRPKLLLLQVETTERRNVTALERIGRLAIPVVFDESARFRIEPRYAPNGLLEFFAAHRHLPLVLLTELGARSTYADLSLTAMVGPPALAAALAVAGEATWGRLPALAEMYGRHLLDQALSFHIALGTTPTAAVGSTKTTKLRGVSGPSASPAPVALSGRLEKLASLPVFADIPRALPPDVVRLDYGENEHAVPARLIEGVLSGLLEPEAPIVPGAVATAVAVGMGGLGASGQGSVSAAAKQAVCAYLQKTRGGSYTSDEILLASGIVPLLADIVHALKNVLGRPPKMVLPAGFYGLFPAIASAAGAELRIAQTEPSLDFRLTPIQAAGSDLVLVTHPGNPTGACYSRAELAALAKSTGLLIVDEVYGLLASVGRDAPFESAALLEEENVGVLVGVSKEFAAGGLRVGALALRHPALRAAIAEQIFVPPSRIALRAAEHLLSVYRLDAAAPERKAVDQYLHDMRTQLEAQRKLLTTALDRLGLSSEGAPSGGGLFLFPEVSDDESMRQKLLEQANVLVHRGAWTGISRHLRLSVGIDPRRMEEALSRLATFNRT